MTEGKQVEKELESVAVTTATTKRGKKRKRPHENALGKLKRYVAAVDNENKHKTLSSEKLAELEKAKQRRTVTNKRRRVLTRMVTWMLEHDLVYTKEGKQLTNVFNVIVDKDNKIYAELRDSQIHWKPYKEEVELADKKVDIPTVSPFQKEYEELLAKFMAGDPEIAAKVNTKKILTDVPIKINVDAARERIKEKFERAKKLKAEYNAIKLEKKCSSPESNGEESSTEEKEDD